MKILFLGETYRADAQTWIKGIENISGFPIDTLEIKTINNRIFRVFQSINFILKLLYLRIMGRKYDIVLAERAASYGFFSLFIKAKIKAIAQQGITDAYPETGFSHFFKKILQTIVYINADIIHAWGKAMNIAQIESNAHPKKIITLPKGLDLSKLNYTKFEPNLSILRIIVTRSLESIYNHDIIIKAIKVLTTNNIPVELNIIGNGSLFTKLNDLTKELEIADKVYFLGLIPNLQLEEYLRNCPLYVSIPVSEGVSSSLQEAMAVGCFPIVSNIPGNQAFITPFKNGLLVSHDNEKELSEAIEYYYKNQFIHSTAAELNREWINKNANRENNMHYFFNRYKEVIETKHNSKLISSNE
jgi:glycosyltransferase involved in cell wall biosynthesis